MGRVEGENECAAAFLTFVFLQSQIFKAESTCNVIIVFYITYYHDYYLVTFL